MEVLVFKKFIGLFAIVTGLLFVHPAQSWAWGKSGHRIVIMIALMHLNPDAREEIFKILNPEEGTRITAVDVANWADDVRTDPRFDLLAPLHFVNVPRDINDYNLIPADKLNPQGDLIRAIEVLKVYLKNNDHEALMSVKAFADLEASGVKIDRKWALYLYLHFLGDLSQPLHMGYEEDFGGNKVHVEVQHKPGNLHSAWDDLLNNFEEYGSTEYAEYLNRQLSTIDKKSWTEKDLYAMAAETMILREKMYQFPDGFVQQPPVDPTKPQTAPAPQVAKIGYKYFYAMVPVLNSQLLKGGVVAANLLNQAFSASAAQSAPLFEVKRQVPAATAAGTCQALFN
jgi:hypothetical protein